MIRGNNFKEIWEENDFADMSQGVIHDLGISTYEKLML